MAEAKVDGCVSCGWCGICDEVRPMKYKEDGKMFCSIDCLRKLWSAQAVDRAEARGLCGKCFAPQHPGEGCKPWVIR